MRSWTPEFFELSFGLHDPAGRDPRSQTNRGDRGRLPVAGVDRSGGAARERGACAWWITRRAGFRTRGRRWSGAEKCCSRRCTRWRRRRCWASRWRVGRLYYATIAQNYTAIDVPLNAWTRRRARAGAEDDRSGAMRDGFLPAAPRKDGVQAVRVSAGVRAL